MAEDLERYRHQIAEIDNQLLKLIKSRLQMAKTIGEIKKQQNLPITNLKIEAEVLNRSLQLAREIGLKEAFTLKLTNMLISEAIQAQENVTQNRSAFLYDIFEKIKRLEATGEKIIRLDVGEPDLASPIELKDTLISALNGSKYVGYTSSKGLKELREAIAYDLNQTYGTEVDAEQILITHGGKFAIFAAILAMITPGDRVIIPEPTWPVYGSCVNLADGRINAVHTRFEDSWNIDIGELEELLRVNPKLFILCSPNNPTGKIFSKKFLREITQLAKRSGTYILSDEVYCAYSSIPFESILQTADSNFIYVNSFSKRYGMTGWRIGYALSDVKTIARMQHLLQISVTCVPEFIQYSALKALKMDQAPFTTFTKNMKQRINTACKELDALPLSYIRPEGGMYIFPKARIENFNSDVFAHTLLDEEKVGVAPGEAFGDYPQHFRISLGTSKENIEVGIRRIGKAIHKWQKK